VGVGALVIHEGRVLLIRRGKAPLRGRWVIPGGTLELGETLEQAVVREVQEETGVTVEPGAIVLVFDRIHRDAQERVVYHYVIVDYACRYVAGEPRAASDALDAAWVAPEDLPLHDVPEQALRLIEEGFRLQASKNLLPRQPVGRRILE
jgi:8-oxo-dGTP diphosphatase